MKINPKAPWYINSEISKDKRFSFNQEMDAAINKLGLCRSCIHILIKANEPEEKLVNGKYGIKIVCSHPERRGPGKGLSPKEPCPFHQGIGLSEATSEATEAWQSPLQQCPECKGTGVSHRAEPPQHTFCKCCSGTGATCVEEK